MANATHVQVLKHGIDEWNGWWRSRKQRDASPDFRGADLKGAQLAGGQFHAARFDGADLTDAQLCHAYLEGATFCEATLRSANLNQANLTGAELICSDASHASFVDASIGGATFQSVKLNCCDFRGAWVYITRLDGVDLSAGDLRDATLHYSWARDIDFTDARFGPTVLANMTLHNTKGLETVRHHAASTIGLDTFFKSGGLPEAFMRGAGLPEEFISYASSLVGTPIQFHSCFISYCSLDTEFASKLHSDLSTNNVRVWFAPEDLKIGDRIRKRIDESIESHDKLLLVLSEASIRSPWVEKEVETAFARERRERQTVLFPVMIDRSVLNSDEPWVTDIINTRHVGDFSYWRNAELYAKAFDRLNRDLKKQNSIIMK